MNKTAFIEDAKILAKVDYDESTYKVTINGEDFDPDDVFEEYHAGATKICVRTNNGYYLKKTIHADDDYAKIEYDIYQLALKENLGKWFAETDFIIDNVYIQEECDATLDDVDMGYDDVPEELRDAFSDEKIVSCKTAVELLDRYNLSEIKEYIRIRVLMVLLTRFSVSELEDLFRFIIKFDINDLHTGNIGFFYNTETKNYDIKLFDFSGYESSTSQRIQEEINDLSA